MTAAVIVALVVGFWLGVAFGRRVAELGRARADMRRTWNGRADYRRS